jgi:hypothetical protein
MLPSRVITGAMRHAQPDVTGFLCCPLPLFAVGGFPYLASTGLDPLLASETTV